MHGHGGDGIFLRLLISLLVLGFFGSVVVGWRSRGSGGEVGAATFSIPELFDFFVENFGIVIVLVFDSFSLFFLQKHQGVA